MLAMNMRRSARILIGELLTSDASYNNEDKFYYKKELFFHHKLKKSLEIMLQPKTVTRR